MKPAKALAARLCAALVLAAPAAACRGPVSGPPSALPNLPLVENPAQGKGDTFVVLYSGDGGWVKIDRGLADGFTKAGVPVVGCDSLRYFWRARTAAEGAADLTAILDHYSAAWRRPKVIVAGYSFGASALPAIVAQLSPRARAHVRLLALVGVRDRSELQFHLGDWLDLTSADARPVAPVLARLGSMPRICVFGDRDRRDACPAFAHGLITAIKVGGDHHFSGDYAPVSAAILRSAGLVRHHANP